MKSVQLHLKAKKSFRKIGMKNSHLYLQDKYLKVIPKVTCIQNHSVVYMYNNCIKTIENLDSFPNLTCLYLQNNHIGAIENMGALKKLKKLYLGHNRISILEGLQSNVNLEELYIEKQSLPEGNSLCFDPRTIIALSQTLRTLKISHNNISSLSSLVPLVNLRCLDASDNDLDDINDVCGAMAHWYYLQDANFSGNAFTKQHRYREKVIVSSMSLVILDGREISDVTRVFVEGFERAKLVRSKYTINT